MFLLTILKDVNLHYKKKCESELRNFFLSVFSMTTSWYRPIFVASEVPWNKIWHCSFAETKAKASELAETHINLDQIYQIRSNWLSPIFFSPGNSHTKWLLVLLHLGLEDVTKVATDSKGRFSSFKVTPSNDRVLCVYAPSGHGISEQLAKGLSLKDYKIILKIRMR